jgi:thiol-disulfide isomerase/thioredoxin
MGKVLLFFCVLVTGCSFNSDDYTGLLGREAPYVRLTSLDGEYYSLGAPFQKVTVIMFWAEWCGYSRPALKDLDSVAMKHPEVRFIAVSIDENDQLSRVQDYIKYQKLTHIEHVFSGNGLYDETYLTMNGKGLPHFLVINKRGLVVGDTHSISGLESIVSNATRETT